MKIFDGEDQLCDNKSSCGLFEFLFGNYEFGKVSQAAMIESHIEISGCLESKI